jgi:hypothetical protein
MWAALSKLPEDILKRDDSIEKAPTPHSWYAVEQMNKCPFHSRTSTSNKTDVYIIKKALVQIPVATADLLILQSDGPVHRGHITTGPLGILNCLVIWLSKHEDIMRKTQFL